MATQAARIDAIEASVNTLAATMQRFMEMQMSTPSSTPAPLAQVQQLAPVPTPTPAPLPNGDAKTQARNTRNALRKARYDEITQNGKTQRWVDLTCQYRDHLAQGERLGFWELKDAQKANVARWAKLTAGTFPQPVGNASRTPVAPQVAASQTSTDVAKLDGQIVSANGKKTFTNQAACDTYNAQCKAAGERLAAGRAKANGNAAPLPQIESENAAAKAAAPKAAAPKAVVQYLDYNGERIIKNADGTFTVNLGGVLHGGIKAIDKAMAAIDGYKDSETALASF